MRETIFLLLVLVVGFNYAHAELTIWQVENNPPGTDSGNEWLTLINIGSADTFDGYDIRTTHGRIASYTVPSITLDTCESHKITFPKQAIDNKDDTVILHKDGTIIYETPVIKDTKNNDSFWTNPDVMCESEPEMTLEQRVSALEERADKTDDIIALLWAEIEVIVKTIL